MEGQLTPTILHSPGKSRFSIGEQQCIVSLTYQVQFPNCIPPNNGNKVPRHQTGSGLCMSLESQDVMSDGWGKVSGHEGSRQQWQREDVVSWPRH